MKSQVLAAAVVLFLAAQPVWSAPGGKKGAKHERERARDSASGPAAGFTPQDAAEAARRETGGRVLDVKPGNGGYRVKVLTPKGEVRYVPVDRGRR